MALQKPEHIDFVKQHSFRSDDMEEAAYAIDDLYEKVDRNLSEIARQTGYSQSHISNTYYMHFGPAGSDKTFEEIDEERQGGQMDLTDVAIDPNSELGQRMDGDGTIDVQEVIQLLVNAVKEASEENYQKGLRDGIEMERDRLQDQRESRGATQES